jgi:hypothetical protein
MARDFGPVHTSLWASKRFWSMPSDASRLFYLYLLSSPHSNSIGCYRLPRGYIAADLKWSDNDISEAIQECSDSLLIAFEEREEVVFITQFLAKNPTTNKNHAIGAVRAALALPDCELKWRVINDLASDKHAGPLDETKAAQSLCKASPEPSRTDTKPIPIPIPDDDGERVRALANQVREIASPSGQPLHPNWDITDVAARRWLANGCEPEDILAGARVAMARNREAPAPVSPAFFDRPIVEAMEDRLKPLPTAERRAAAISAVGAAPPRVEEGHDDEIWARFWNAGRRNFGALRDAQRLRRMVAKGLIEADDDYYLRTGDARPAALGRTA